MVKRTALTSSFRKIIECGSLYIDKTNVLYNLLAQASADDSYFFLARPRRFGKTLFISMLEELFAGNRQLFKGLWIDSSDYTWEKHPVISLDFSQLNSRSPAMLEYTLSLKLDEKAQQEGFDLSAIADLGTKLNFLVKRLAAHNRVVILIDEYDYPLLNNLHDVTILEENRRILSDFFTVIKSLESDLRALFITGVSQIAKTSIFSGMNIPNNISLDPIAANLLGYTKEEIQSYFSKQIIELAQSEGLSVDEILEKIQRWYNGYRFSEAEVKVYNPFSLHYLFTKKKFANYWFRSGTPTFLLNLLKKNKYILETSEERPVSEENLSSLTIESPRLASLLFQTGYLTIDSYDRTTDSYTLTYPNHEVRESYSILLLSAITGKEDVELKNTSSAVKQALEQQDTATLCSLLGSIFAHIPYQIDKREEAHYHALVHQFFVMLEVDVISEMQTNKGRIDLVAFTDKYIYLFELKVNATPENALAQIEKRTYYERFLTDSKKRTIVLVGLAFNKKDNETTVSCVSKTIPH